MDLTGGDDLGALEETLGVLADPRLRGRLDKAEAVLDRSEGLDELQLIQVLQRHPRPG